MEKGLELLAERAVRGDQGALEALIAEIHGDVHRLASRMLGHRSDAEDASQEILIKVVTHLASFRGESAFRTWVWRVACNHLLATRRTRAERAALLAALLGQPDGSTVAPQPTPAPDQALMMEQVKACCVRGFLSLDRDHRIALMLSEIFELSSEEGAEVLAIKAAAFRKRLSRAKERLRSTMTEQCSMVGSERRCQRCLRRELPLEAVPDAITEQLREMEDLSGAALALRAEPAGRKRVLEQIRGILTSGRFRALAS